MNKPKKISKEEEKALFDRCQQVIRILSECLQLNNVTNTEGVTAMLHLIGDRLHKVASQKQFDSAIAVLGYIYEHGLEHE